MRKLKLFFACLLMAVLSTGQMWATTYKLTKVTSVETGKLYVFERNSHVFNNTSASSALQTTATYKTTGLEGTESYVWTLETATGGFYLKNVSLASNQYLNNASKTTVSFGAASSIWTIAFTGEVALISNTSNSNRFLGDAGKDSPNNTYKAYATSNLNDYEHDITVYVLDEEGGTPVTPVPVTGVTLNKSKLELEVDASETLTATVAPNDATNKTVSWESSNTAVATVTNGAVTAVAEGSATITVTTEDGSFTDECEVTVIAAAPAVEYVKFTGDIEEGDYVIYYGGKVVKNVVASNRLSYEEVTPVNDKIKNPSDAIIWHIAPAETEGYWTLYNENVSKYAVCTNSNNQANLNATATANALVTVSEVSEGNYEILSKARQDASSNNYYFRNNGTYGFAFYASGTGGALTLYKNASAAPAVAKPTISGDENFVTSTTVTISHADADHIYYTTNGDAPTTSSAEYSAPFTVNADGTTTVKAIAVKGSASSAVAEKTFTKVEALESLAALLEATTSTETAFNVVISNWVVTGVSGTRAWIADAANEKGILLYKSGHNFVAGNKLNGVVMGTKTKLYQGYPELTTLVSTDVTVTTAEAVTPRTTTIAALTSGYNKEQGTVVKLENLTYTASSTSFSDGENTLALNTQLYNPSMVDGAIYTVIGVVRYDNEAAISIMPRSVDDVEQTGEASLPEVTGLADLKAETTGASYLLNLTDAVVTLVDGNNAFIQDETAGALIYFSGHGLAAGDKLNGQYEVTTATYQGKFEITAMTAQDGATKTADAEIPVTTLTISQLADNANFAANESKRIKIVGVNVTDAIANNDRNGQISDGENTFALYAGKNGIAAAENDNIDIIGYPTFFNEAHQFNVWAQADITVNEKEDPELAYNPTGVNVLLSDLASFEPADLEYATGFDGVAAITYESSDPSIATVETDGTVTIVATAEGSTTITATFTGNATYKADNASYTINVTAAPIAPVYTMSFDMTRASYDAAADAQVVWNSSVVTMTANKNDGTKVTNYLAGNYTGTTLIAETRFYAKNSISFVPQAGVTITKIEWMSTAKGYATKLAAETFVNATAVVDVTDDKLVIITPSAAGEISVTLNDAARATGVTVYYEAESEKAKLAASIAIANINMAVGDDDILLSDIAATSNPNKKAISYAITSGTAVSLVGEGKDAAFYAVEAGTATITATIPNDLGNYTGATTTFDIVVAAAPATLVSIAISGEATALEYTEGQDFTPAGLAVTGTYSDASTAPITEGITWAFDPSPLTAGTTSVFVTATVSEITSDAFEVNGLTVSAAPVPVTDNVVILAVYDEKYYAMSTTNANNGFTAIEVEYDGSQVTVNSQEDKDAIQWTRTTNGDNTTFQDANEKYMKSADGASMSLQDAVCNWLWDATGGYYKIAETARTFFFQNTSGGIFKNYATSNLGGNGYSDKAQVIAIAAENIVITSKVDPELAYTPDELEIAAEDVASWEAPALGYVVGFDGLAAIEYGSNNESVATVTEGGEIALAGGYGTAVITATFAGNNNYLAGSATYTITVNAPAPTPTGTTYTKVTSTGEITDGEYLIVYETTSVAFNGALETLDAEGNSVAVVINEGVIAGTTAIDAAVFTIDVTAGTLQSASGKYIGVSSNSNGLKQTEDASTYTHTFSIDGDGNAVIFANFEGSTMKLRYNPSTSTGNLRFRYYKNDGQYAIQLYKKDTPVDPEPVWEELREGAVSGKYYTVCLSKKVVDFRGGIFWNLSNRNGNMAYLEEATVSELAAGKPFIFEVTDTKLEVVYEGAAATAAGSNGALHGTFAEMDQAALSAAATAAGSNIFLLSGNKLWNVTISGAANNHIAAGRAYIVYEELVDATPAPAPGRRVRAIPMQEQVATGIDGIEPSEISIQKVMIDGQLFILRGEKMYDATGRLVK